MDSSSFLPTGSGLGEAPFRSGLLAPSLELLSRGVVVLDGNVAFLDGFFGAGAGDLDRDALRSLDADFEGGLEGGLELGSVRAKWPRTADCSANAADSS